MARTREMNLKKLHDSYSHYEAYSMEQLSEHVKFA